MEATKTFLDMAAEHLDRLQEIEEERTNIATQKAALRKPEVPAYVETYEQWDQFCDTIRKYNSEIDRIQAVASIYDDEEKAIHKDLHALPSNTWFKVETKKGTRWIGIQTNDWGGGERHLLIRQERPTEPLKHIVTR
jgi:hypothetical protein